LFIDNGAGPVPFSREVRAVSGLACGRRRWFDIRLAKPCAKSQQGARCADMLLPSGQTL